MKMDYAAVVAAAAAAAANGTVQELIAQSQAKMPVAISDLQPSPEEREKMDAQARLMGINPEDVHVVHVGYLPPTETTDEQGRRVTVEEPIFVPMVGIPVDLVLGNAADEADDE